LTVFGLACRATKYPRSKEEDFMKRRIQEWGSRLALCVSKRVAEEASLREDSAVDVTVRSGKLVVVAIEEPHLSLENLVSKITPSNRHSEVETGKAVGNEVW
jgi:antitoxin component of MazEF toxin-antitoxin module